MKFTDSAEETIVKKVLEKKESLTSNILNWAKHNSTDYPWRSTSNPYHIFVSELLLRKTGADQVARVYKNFIKDFPSLDRLATADVDSIRAVIQSLGLNYRSKWIKEVSERVYEECGTSFPRDKRKLKSVLGNNRRYLYYAIRSFAFGEDVAIFDVNISRILRRIFSIEFGSDPHKGHKGWYIASLLIPKGLSKKYNWAMIDLGRIICTAHNPKCSICPLNRICDFARTNVS